MVIKLSEDEIEKIRELAKKIGREDPSLTPMEIKEAMCWTVTMWRSRRHLIPATGIKIADPNELARQKRDAARGKANIGLVERALYTDLRHDMREDRKTAIRALRAYDARPIDAESIRRLALEFGKDEPDMPGMRLLLSALKITRKMWEDMEERRERLREEAEAERERARAEEQKKTDGEVEAELERLGSEG